MIGKLGERIRFHRQDAKCAKEEARYMGWLRYVVEGVAAKGTKITKSPAS